MGFIFSKIACVDNERKCNYNDPITLTDYTTWLSENKITDDIKNMTPEQKQKLSAYLCGGHVISEKDNTMMCCDPSYKNMTGSKEEEMDLDPMKAFYDVNGKIKELHVCSCSGTKEDVEKCRAQYCQGFNDGNPYTTCKAYSQQQNMNSMDPQQPVTKLKLDQLAPDCYNTICETAPVTPVPTVLSLPVEPVTGVQEKKEDYNLLLISISLIGSFTLFVIFVVVMMLSF